jgi:ribose transport system permease protein
MERKIKSSTSFKGIINSFLRIRELPLLLIVILMMITLSYLSPAFFHRPNFLSLARGFAIEGTTLIAMTMLLVSGVFDLSVGSVMALSGVVCSMLMVANIPLPLAILGGLLVGMFCGTFNAFIITRFNINPFIVTFAMLSIARSVAQAVTQSNPIRVNNSTFSFMGTGLVSGIPFGFIIVIILVILADFAMRKVRFFRQLYFIGGNEAGARLIGINTKKIKIIAFIFSGLLAAWSGILSSARLSGAVPNAYVGIELKLIVAAVIGGCTLKGGEGTVAGSMLGLVFLFLLSNAMTLLGIDMYWEPFIYGAFLIVVVLYNMYNPGKFKKRVAASE